MKRAIIKGSVLLCGIAWLILTGTGGAPWPVVLGPVLLLLWATPSEPVPPELSDLVIQLEVLNERFSSIDDRIRALDDQLSDHGEKLAHLVDEQLHAMRQRGEIPWPEKT